LRRWAIGRAGARHRRRLIRLIAVGWCPPDVPPSGAGLPRGPRVPAGLGTSARGAPHRGCASAERRGHPAALWGHWRAGCWPDGVTGTCRALTPRKPASARAMATTTGFACVPRERPSASGSWAPSATARESVWTSRPPARVREGGLVARRVRACAGLWSANPRCAPEGTLPLGSHYG
jgi:hypothetical protein